jgi:hypothetical protein
MEELKEVMAEIRKLQKRYDPEKLRALEQRLKQLEAVYNSLLNRASSGAGELASRMRGGIHGTGRFAGTRMA